MQNAKTTFRGAITLSLFLLSAIFFQPVHAQYMDCNFGDKGLVTKGNGSSLNGVAMGNNKIFVGYSDGGNFRYYQFAADGSYESASSSIDVNGDQHSPHSTAFSNGGVIMSGTSNFPNSAGGKRKAIIVKFNANGTKAWERNNEYGITHTDHSFMTTDPNGKILLCGNAIGQSGNHSDQVSLVARLHTDGITDKVYQPNFFVNNNGYPGPAEGFQRVGSNGTYVYAAGSIDNGSNYRKIRVVKLNDSNFARDLNFGTNGYADFELASNKYFSVEWLGVQSDNKVVMLINWESTYILVRLNADGSFDNSFAGNGKLNIGSLSKRLYPDYAISLQDDDKLLISGLFDNSYRMAAIRLNTDGTLDTGFGGNGLSGIFTAIPNDCINGIYDPATEYFLVLAQASYTPRNAYLAKFNCAANALQCTPPIAKCKDYATNYVDTVVTIDPAELNDNSFIPNAPGTLTASPGTFDCSHIGVNTVTLEVLDPNGLSSTCTANVTINDLVPPTVTCPGDITVNTDPGQACGTVQFNLPTLYDNCGDKPASVLIGPNPGDCVLLLYATGGFYNVTLGGTDAGGNLGSCTFKLTIADNQAPVARCKNATVNLNQLGVAPIIAADINNFSSDNGSTQGNDGLKFKTIDINSFNCGQVTNNVVTLTVTDYDNNTSSCTATVTVQDPAHYCAALEYVEARCKAATVNLDMNAQASITATDINNGSITSAGFKSLAVAPSSFSCAEVGVQTVTLTVKDSYDNTSNCTAAVTVNNPILIDARCQSLTLALDASGHAATAASAIDNGSNHTCSISLSLDQSSFDCAHIGSNTVTLTVSSSDGSEASCTATVLIEDHVAPTAACQSRTLELDATGNISLTAQEVGNNSNDVCSNVNLSLSQTAFDCSHTGPNTVTLTVTDASQNSSSCSANIEIVDLIDPQISCPPNLSLSNDPGICGRMITYLTPVGTDNCNRQTVMTHGLGSGSVFPLGTTTEAYMVTDASGNTAACSFTVTVTDDEKPVITLNGANPMYLCEGEAYVEAGATATDNCDGNVNQNIQINNSSVNTSQEGSYSVTYKLTDVNGNIANEVTRTVIVKHTPGQLASQNCGSCDQIRFDFCEGEAVPDLEALLTANANYEAGATFLWYKDDNNGKGSAIPTPIVNTSSNNNQFYWVSQLIGSCESVSKQVRMRVRKTSIVVLDLPAIGCGTGQIDLAAYVSDNRGIATGFTFYDADPKPGTPSLGTVSASSGQVNSGQYAVVSLPSGPVTYYAVASNHTGCQVTGSDEVIASAGASLNPVANLTVNSGDLVQVSFASPDATHILWFNHSSFNNPYIGLLGSIGFGDLVFTANNISATVQTATIRAIAYNGNCAGQVRDFTITVNPGTNNRQAGYSLQLTASNINAHDVQLNWLIYYEFALTGIEIEKQKNDGEWEMIDQQDGDQHGVGSHYNVTLQDGSYLDRSGMGNVTKYRLKLIHPDGRAIWSRETVVSHYNVTLQNTERFTLYPNPSDGRFNLRAAGPLEGEWRYKLSDQLGRTILIGKLTGSETAFDISHLLPLSGTHYFLLLTSPEGKSYLQKIVKY